MIRGGSWNNKPRNLRSAKRNRNNNLGFRLAQSARAAVGRTRSRPVHGQAGRGARVSTSLFPGLAGRGAPNSMPGTAGGGAGRLRPKAPSLLMLNRENRKLSDIFISYKREEQDEARQLAVALEKQGWSVWWDPKLRAGEYFDDVIEKALNEARCVIVMWSKRSAQSRYVKDEASYALDFDKLVPVAIEEVHLPFRFRNIQTPQLIHWDGSDQFMAFKSLVGDIVAKLGQPTTAKLKQVLPAESQRKRVATAEPSGEDRVTGTVFQDTLKDSSKGPEMVFIAGGKFQMGTDPEMDSDGDEDEQPRHEVTIGAFSIGKHEVTFAEYDTFANATNRELPEDEGWGRGRQPVINVSWQDAMAYTKWLSEQTGKRYRLPTEAEWEYAARAGTDTNYWWGNDIQQQGKVWANCAGCGSQWDGKQTAPVGSFKPNVFGVYDMLGNALEWVQDCWHDSYKGSPDDGSAWERAGGGACAGRMIRGGFWDGGPGDLRSAKRYMDSTVYRYNYLGFRLAQDVD